MSTKFIHFEPGQSRMPPARRIGEDEWRPYRQPVEDLYVRQNKTETTVRRFLHANGFHPTKKQLVSQLKKWQMFKNGIPSRRSDDKTSINDTIWQAADELELESQTQIEDETTDITMTDLTSEDHLDEEGDDKDNVNLPWSQSEDFDLDECLPTISQSSGVVLQREAEARVLMSPPSQEQGVQSHQEDTRRLQGTANPPHHRAQPTFADEVLPDLGLEPMGIQLRSRPRSTDDLQSQLDRISSIEVSQQELHEFLGEASEQIYEEFEYIIFPDP